MRVLGELSKAGRTLGSLDESMAALSHSQATMDKIRADAQQAELAAQQAAAPTTIAQETAKGTMQGVFGGLVKTGKSVVQAVGEAFGAKAPESQPMAGQQEPLNFAGEPLTTYQQDIEQGQATVPEAAGNIALDVASVAPIGKGLQLGKQALGMLKEPLKPIAKGLSGIGSTILEKTGISRALENRAIKKNIGYALDLTSPKITQKTGAEAIEQGRFVEPGILKPAKVTPTQTDNLVAESVADVVSPKASLTENVDAIHQRISQTNHGVREMIADN